MESIYQRARTHPLELSGLLHKESDLPWPTPRTVSSSLIPSLCWRSVLVTRRHSCYGLVFDCKPLVSPVELGREIFVSRLGAWDRTHSHPPRLQRTRCAIYIVVNCIDGDALWPRLACLRIVVVEVTD